MNRFLFSTLVLSVVIAGCKKEDSVTPSLPEATSAGLNTAGCRVDGKVWLPVQQFLYAGPATEARLQKSVTGQQLNISLGRYPVEEGDAFNETTINFYLPDIRTAGTFALNQFADPKLTTSSPAYATFTYAKPSPDQVLITGPAATGQLVITKLDTVGHIIAGTFEFTAKEQAGARTVTVAEGRFDLKY